MPPTPRTTPTRHADRVRHDLDQVHRILDETLVCHLGFTVDGEPRVLPTLHARDGDTLYLHGSTGSRPMLEARGPEGLPVCVTVTLIDGLVLARSQFHHSVNYRSVMIHGRARLVAEAEAKRRALAVLVDHVAPGRSEDSRPANDRELAQTAVLALPLTECSSKIRSGGVVDEPEDLALPHWAGVVPLRLVAGTPQPDTLGAVVALPPYLRDYRREP